MNDLTLKFNLLEPDARKQVLDFMEFLLSKAMKPEDPVKTDYKKKILKVSVWSDAEIDLMIKNQQQFNQWKAQEW